MIAEADLHDRQSIERFIACIEDDGARPLTRTQRGALRDRFHLCREGLRMQLLSQLGFGCYPGSTLQMMQAVPQASPSPVVVTVPTTPSSVVLAADQAASDAVEGVAASDKSHELGRRERAIAEREERLDRAQRDLVSGGAWTEARGNRSWGSSSHPACGATRTRRCLA